MVKLTKNIKSKKQKIAQRHRKTKAVRKRNNTLHGGAGGYVKQWKDQLEFDNVNSENEKMMLISNKFNGNPQHSVYYNELENLLKFENFEINMDFISNFYKHIYYDINNNFAIDLRDGRVQWFSQAFSNDNITYKITKYFINPAHGNTSIVFLEGNNDATKKKVIKIFNKIPVNMNDIQEYLSLEISHISPTSRNIMSQNNYMHFKKLDEFKVDESMFETFNMFNFNHKKYNIPEVSEQNTFLSLACRNSDPVNEYIINLIIGFINSKFDDDKKIQYVHYDNLFVTKIYTKSDPYGKLCWCLLMDMVDGSLDSLILKSDEQILSNDTILDYLTQAENLLKPLKTADYLFTHTDMKLENLFYKKNGEKAELYLADLDKASITFKGIRFYNDLRESPSVKLAGISLDPVQGLSSVFKGDEYNKNTYNDRKTKAAANGIYEYRISRVGRVNPLPVSDPNSAGIEFESFYMRYNNQPFYTSFDMITLWLSFLHFRNVKLDAIVDFKVLKALNSDIGPKKILSRYMTPKTINLLIDYYARLSKNYNGNFGLLLKPIYDREKLQLEEIKFLHHYNSNEQPKLISGLYLTKQNKIALSLPFAPTSIEVSGDITSFKPDKKRTEELFFYKKSDSSYVKKFIDKLDTENILNTTYSGDYSIAAERGEVLKGIGHLKPPTYIIKTNRYSHSEILLLFTNTVIYEWDYMVKDPVLKLIKKNEEDSNAKEKRKAEEKAEIKEEYTENDIAGLIKLFTRLSKNTYSHSRSSSN